MTHGYPYTTVVTVLALLVYLWMMFKVGGARRTYSVAAPSIDGPPEFMRIYRVHMNSLEQIVVFLPALWMFANAWGDVIAACVGIFWPIGRLLYARGYYAAAEKRGPGFGISFLSAAILLIGTIVGLAMSFI